MASTKKPILPKPSKHIDEKLLKTILANLDEDNLNEEDGQEAADASRALENVRRVFYGTALEDIISEVIGLCDAVYERAEEIHG